MSDIKNIVDKYLLANKEKIQNLKDTGQER